MHVVLRFELERALFGGKVSVAELPDLWRERMRELLGASFRTQTPSGALGTCCGPTGLWLFPLDTLGAMCRRAVSRQDEGGEMAGFDELVAAGKFTPIRDWLREKIHSVGSLYPSADELCETVTGAPLDPSIYVEHLNKKYSALYGVAE